jgi:hypothetical protein
VLSQAHTTSLKVNCRSVATESEPLLHSQSLSTPTCDNVHLPFVRPVLGFPSESAPWSRPLSLGQTSISTATHFSTNNCNQLQQPHIYSRPPLLYMSHVFILQAGMALPTPWHYLLRSMDVSRAPVLRPILHKLHLEIPCTIDQSCKLHKTTTTTAAKCTHSSTTWLSEVQSEVQALHCSCSRCLRFPLLPEPESHLKRSLSCQKLHYNTQLATTFSNLLSTTAGGC